MEFEKLLEKPVWLPQEKKMAIEKQFSIEEDDRRGIRKINWSIFRIVVSYFVNMDIQVAKNPDEDDFRK